MKKSFGIKSISAVLASVFMISSFGEVAYAQLPYSNNHLDASYGLDREEINSATSNRYKSDDVVYWNDYFKAEKDVHDGKIPASLLDDPVYCSMNLPSESQSDFMIEAWRDNAHIIGDCSSPESQKMLAMGAVYLSNGKTLPEKFSIYLGKIKLFAYSRSQKKWITLDSEPYPIGVYLFELPWEKHKTYQCKNYYKTSDFIRIDLKASDMKNRVLHFWGNTVPINKKDYQYYACAFDFWVSSSANGRFTATSGIDTKNQAGTSTVAQIYCSRGLTCTTTRKTQWGQTIPNWDYERCNGASLNQLFEYGESGKETTDSTGGNKGGSNSGSSGSNSGSSGNISNNGSSSKSSNTGNNSNTGNGSNTGKNSNTGNSSNTGKSSNAGNSSNKGSSSSGSSGSQSKGTATGQTEKHAIVDGNTISKDSDNDGENTEQEKNKKKKIKTPAIVKIAARSTSLIVQWKNKAAKAKGYQIQYSTDKNFKKGVKTVKIKNKKTTKKTIYKLKKGSLYYFRVRAYSKNADGKSYSKWSKVKEVKLK